MQGLLKMKLWKNKNRHSLSASQLQLSNSTTHPSVSISAGRNEAHHSGFNALMRGQLINDDAANALSSCSAHIYPTVPFKSDKMPSHRSLKKPWLRDQPWDRHIFSSSGGTRDAPQPPKVRLYSDFQTWHPQSFRGPLTTPTSVSPRRQPASWFKANCKHHV